MGLFRPYDKDAKDTAKGTANGTAAPSPEPVETPTTRPVTTPKNRPTPTRQAAEAARMAARHPKLTRKEMRDADRATDNKRQVQQMAALDARPERVLMRNYVDARWSVLEIMWGVLLVLLAASLVGGSIPLLLLIVTGALWLVVVVGVVNFVFSWHGFKAELASRYPNASSKGLMMAMLSRMAVFRRMRQPAPIIKRGEEY